MGSYMKNMEERLWDFIDGTSNPNEKIEITRLLETNHAWQKAYIALLDMNASLLQTPLEGPSMRFSKNVMEEIAKHKIAPSTKSYVNKKIIYGIAGFFLTLIAGLLAYLFTQIDFSQQGFITLPSDLFSFKLSDQTNSTILNIFLMVDAVLGLMLLDKYLQKGKAGFKQNEI